jgi:hypothetical protein
MSSDHALANVVAVVLETMKQLGYDMEAHIDEVEEWIGTVATTIKSWKRWCKRQSKATLARHNDYELWKTPGKGNLI